MTGSPFGHRSFAFETRSFYDQTLSLIPGHYFLGRLMPPKSSTLCFAALVVALVTATLMLATEPRLAIVWDEGYTLGREARLRLWFRALADPVAFA